MKKKSISRKILSMILTVSMLISILPFENIFAEWTTPNNITINDSTGTDEISYFINLYGTPQYANMYYVAGQPEDIAYCIDAEARGPGGTAYVINDSAIDAVFRNGLARIAQFGYPTNNWVGWGISASEAQYATQAAMHWWENVVFGGTEGWVRTGVQNNGCPTNFAGTLGYADWLLSLAGSNTSPTLLAQIASSPSSWSAGNPPTSTFSVYGYDCDYWVLTLPAGVTIAGSNTFTGSGNASITANLTDTAVFGVGSKTVTVQGFSNRTGGQIHYYVAGGGYQNMIVFQQSVSEAGDPDGYPFPDATGTLSLYKQTEWTNGVYTPEAGAAFEVINSDAIVVAAVTTDASGNASVSLPYGTYTIHQVSGPEYAVFAPDQTYIVSAGTATAAFMNTAFTGQIEINKTYEAVTGSVPEGGAVFQIYPNGSSYETSTDYQHDQITTNSSGYAISKSLPYGTYTLVQTGAPIGSQLNTGLWTFELGIDGTTYINGDVDTVSISNTPSYGKLEISKTLNRGYDVPESGAVFEVYSSVYVSYAAAPASLKDLLTTSASGTGTTRDLPYGVYFVHQSAMPAGTKAAADFSITLGTVNEETIHRNLVNETYWGDIQILKYKSAPSSTSGILTPEPDASFRIYPSFYSSWEQALAALPADQELVLTDEITSDFGGNAVTRHQLPYGEYTVEQIDTLVNRYTFKVDAWQVFIGAADNQTYSYVRNNEIYEQYLSIIKTDAATGQVIKLPGAAFEILAADGVTVLTDKNGGGSFVTDTDGRIDIRDLALQVGNYFIRETAAPMGYVLNQEMKAFAVSITDHGSSIVTIDYGVDIRGELFADTAQTCQLIVEKKGDILTSATLIDAINPETGDRYSDTAGKALSNYQFEYSLTGKPGAVFEVFVGAKDICDNNGLLKSFDKDGDGINETALAAGKSLGTITTSAMLQKDGTVRYIAAIAGLPLDAATGTAQYIVREVTAPTGDLINPDLLTFDFIFADQTVTQIDQVQSVTDIRQKVQITVEKQKESMVWNVNTKSYDSQLIAAPEILFGIYTAHDILAADGSVLVTADALVDVLYTDEAGAGISMQDLPMGEYYAKEVSGTPDVVVDISASYPVTAAPTEDQTASAAVFTLNDGKAIINRGITGMMKIIKKAADTNLAMTGVVFEVFDAPGNLVDTITTGTDGQAKTRLLPYGSYYFVETHTSNGYSLSGRIDFSIEPAPSSDMDISEDEITILNYLIPVTPTPMPTPATSPAPPEILGVYRESVSKTGEQGGSKIAAGVMLLLLFVSAQFVLKRRRHLDSEK